MADLESTCWSVIYVASADAPMETLFRTGEAIAR
jgi:hypothetical protein